MHTLRRLPRHVWKGGHIFGLAFPDSQGGEKTKLEPRATHSLSKRSNALHHTRDESACVFDRPENRQGETSNRRTLSFGQ